MMTVSKLCAKAASEDRTLMFAAIAWALIAAVPNAQAAGLDTASGHKTVAGKVTGAIESPLRDVNLMKTEIPAVLQDARRAPYAPVAGASCQSLGAEIALLDRALGRDFDAVADAKPSNKDKAVDKAIDAGGSAASRFIPYRGIVRFVSGAEKHDKLVAESLLAGSIRRGYLKGVGETMGCSYPGAPMREVAVDQAE